MYQGGYHTLNQPLITQGVHRHTAADPNALSDGVLEAVNLVQGTPWRINQPILEIMSEIWESGASLGGLPPASDKPVPPRMTEETWALANKEVRQTHIQARQRVHEFNARCQSKREALIRRLNLAQKLAEREAIWFPHFLDFRTRLYPMPQDLTPQGDDSQRGLLEFAVGKSLGDDGLHFLMIKLANTGGQDKLSFEDRTAWVESHWELIKDSVVNPLDGERFWCSDEIDEPWGFLATAQEYVWARAFDNPTKFVSHHPIPLDGTCNGLQHLSLMGRDPVGAVKTNCGDQDQRYDLYSEVSEACRKLVAPEAAAGVPEAAEWMIKGIDRKTVKRAVMTLPYGVTPGGIRMQLVQDKHTAGMRNEPSAATYLMKKILEGISNTVSAASEIMAYFQATSLALAHENLPLRWETPMGARITQSYYGMAEKQVRTLLGKWIHLYEAEEMGLDPRKATLAASPNVIHSLDASMLQDTVRRLNRDHGISDFAMIHDSYGVHASHSRELGETLRRVAYDMYKEPWLPKFHANVRSYAPGVELPELPKLGDFEVSEVLRAPYFFA